jgi:hypothetical protein
MCHNERNRQGKDKNRCSKKMKWPHTLNYEETYMMGENELKTPTDCIDIAIVDAHEDEQIYCWIECLKNVFDGVDSVNLSGKKVAFLGFEYVDDDTLSVIYKKNNKIEKVDLNTIEFIKPTKIQQLWIDGYNLWRSYLSY